MLPDPCTRRSLEMKRWARAGPAVVVSAHAGGKSHAHLHPQGHHVSKDDGASAVEYGLLVAAIAALIVIIVFALGGLVKERLQGHLRQDQVQREDDRGLQV